MVFQCINIRQFPWEVLKTEAEGNWRMLMHEKPCLIPILNLAVVIVLSLESTEQFIIIQLYSLLH